MRRGDERVIAIVHENPPPGITRRQRRNGANKQRKSRKGECLISGAFIISHRVTEEESEKEMGIRGSAVYDYRRCYIFLGEGV